MGFVISQENEISLLQHNFSNKISLNDSLDFIITRPIGFSSQSFSVFKFDKTTNNLDSLFTYTRATFSGQVNAHHVFDSGLVVVSYPSGSNVNNQVCQLHWVALDGIIVTSTEFLSISKIYKLNGSDLIFSKKNQDNTFSLQQFSITSGEITNLFTLNESMLDIFSADESDILVTSDNDNEIKFYDLQSYFNPNFLFGFPVTFNIGSIRYIGEFMGLNYFRAFGSSSSFQEVWGIDLLQGLFEFYAQIPAGLKIELDNNLAYTPSSVFIDGEIQYLRGTFDNLSELSVVPFSNQLAGKNNAVTSSLSSKIARGYSYKHGFEPFYISDSIYLLTDFAKNIASGWMNTSFLDNGFGTVPFFIIPFGTDSCYTVMTNFSDDQYYVYSIKDTTFQSYFPIERNLFIRDASVYNNNLYWIISDPGITVIKYRSLIENLQPQSTISNEELNDVVWSRNLFYVNEKNVLFTNDRQHLSNIKLLNDGSVIAATRRAKSVDYHLANEKYEIVDKAFGSFLVYKLDSVGKLQWQNSFGSDNFGTWLLYPLLMEVDSNEDLYFSGSFFKTFFTKNDTINVNRNAHFILKMNGESGEIEWIKIISQNYYLSDFYVDNMKIYDDELFLTFFYTGFNCNISNTTLTNQWASPINALAKYNLEGELIFAKNIPTDWTNQFGYTWMLDVENDNIATIQAQGAYNWSSSCAYNNWGYFNQISDTQGNVNDVVSLFSTDLGGVKCGFLNENELYAFGHYRGTLDLGFLSYTTPTPNQNNCNLMRGFIYKYNLDQGFIEMKVSNEYFFPFFAKHFGNNYYVYGRGENNELTLVKFNKNGQEIGYKPLGQYQNDLSLNIYQYFDVNEDFIVLSGNMFVENEEYKIPKPITLHHYMTIIKTRNDNWLNDKKIFKNVPRNIQDVLGDDIIVYPNPSDGVYNLMFENPIYNEVEVYDVSGHLVFSMSLNDDEIQTIDLQFLAQGIYMLRLFNSEESRTIRVMKN
jgi:hypothetical protein